MTHKRVRVLALVAALLLSCASASAQLITSQGAGSITSSGATINWTTCAAANSLVDYGLTTAYGSETVLNPTLATSHGIALTGLLPGMIYHFKVTSVDAGGNTLQGVDGSFMTSGVGPVVTANPVSVTVCNGAIVSFTAAASGTPTPSVQWKLSTDGGSTYNNITGATSTTYSFTALTSQSGYKYEAVFTNASGSATSTAATLTLNTAPVVTTQPLSVSVVAGATATFTAAGSGSPSPNVQWQVSTDGGTTWTDIPGATSTTLNVTSTTVGQSGNKYRARFTNSCTAVTSSSLFAASTPAILDSGQATAGGLDVGIKFQSTIAGQITAVRFYKSTGNTGTHLGTVWSASGSNLGSATFTGETASGWQEQALGTPVAIAANTPYVVSYHMQVGHFSYSNGFGPVSNPPLSASASFYTFGGGSSAIFPSTSSGANYFADFVFQNTTTVNTSPATLTVTPGATWNISSTANSDRSSGTFLQGQTLSGSKYIFSSLANAAATFNLSGVAKICYWLDDPTMSGPGVGCDFLSPFDYSSTSALAARVQVVGTQNLAGGIDHLPLATPAVAGNFLAVAIHVAQTGSAPSITDNLGSTYTCPVNFQGPTGTTNRTLLCFLKNVPPGITSITVNTPEPHMIIAAEYAGVEGTSDGSATPVFQNATTSWSSGSVVTSTIDLLLGFASSGSGASVAYSPGAGWTAVKTQTNATDGDSSFLEERLNVAPGTSPATGTTAANAVELSTIAAFRVGGGLKALDTTKLSNGQHTITQQVTATGGGTEIDKATFTVSNTVANHSFDLSWVKGTASNPVTYNVYRAAGACTATPSWTRILSGLGTPAYTDTSVAAAASGTLYCYSVSQVDSLTAQESAKSNLVTATIP